MKLETKALSFSSGFISGRPPQPYPYLMERFKGSCPHRLLLHFSLDECDLNSHISILLFFHSDSLSHELKEEPIDFPIA